MDKRAISTVINVLADDFIIASATTSWKTTMADMGYTVARVDAGVVNLTCEPDNMLVTEYQQKFGSNPVTMNVYRIVINGSSALPLPEATRLVVNFLPQDAMWYGTSNEGGASPEIDAVCQLPPM